MKLLFICNAGMHRSPTAADIAKGMGHESRSIGIRQGGDEELRGLLAWADTVFVMETWMRKEISERFPEEYLKKTFVVLDIQDIYRKDQPELVDILETKLAFI